MIYNRLDCSGSTLRIERNKRSSRLNAGIRRRRPIFCLFRQIRGLEGAEQSAIKIERYNNALNEFEEAGEIELGVRVYFGVTLHKNKVYILGGSINGVPRKSVSMPQS